MYSAHAQLKPERYRQLFEQFMLRSPPPSCERFQKRSRTATWKMVFINNSHQCTFSALSAQVYRTGERALSKALITAPHSMRYSKRIWKCLGNRGRRTTPFCFSLLTFAFSFPSEFSSLRYFRLLGFSLRFGCKQKRYSYFIMNSVKRIAVSMRWICWQWRGRCLCACSKYSTMHGSDGKRSNRETRDREK